MKTGVLTMDVLKRRLDAFLKTDKTEWSLAERYAFLLMLCVANGSGEVPETVELSELVNNSRRNVRRTMRRLARRRLVEIIPQYWDGGGRRANLYQLAMK